VRRIFGNRRTAQVAFLLIFLVIMGFVRGFFDPESRAVFFVPPIVAGIATVVLSYWIRARMVRE
jgi:hypothetical protein